MDTSDNAISNLRRAETMPRIDGKKFDQLCASLTKLSKIREPVTPYDLIEYLPSQKESSTRISSSTLTAGGAS
jgi:putative transcriptional regulator